MSSAKHHTVALPTPGDIRISVVGLGYVGLPLVVAFGGQYPTTGFDVDAGRIAELRTGRDRTLEVEPSELRGVKNLGYTDSVADLAACNVHIVTVPTPIDRDKRPDLTFLLTASEQIAQVIKSGDVVIYESTVYPGATEEECVPVIERGSGLRLNIDFFVGYSPERINPGDPERRITKITKVTSGSTPDAAAFIDALYRAIIPAGTFQASSIRVAEAAKVIENTQRDLNIALINELAIIFNRLGIDTRDVLEAAGTKWNFLPFQPGLVGGHCIGVDPYYLTHKAQSVGYHPEIILSGRRINDGMGDYAVAQLVKKMIQQRIQVDGSRVLLMGLTFKENCPDLRNTRVIDIVRGLEDYNVHVDVHDPWAGFDAALAELDIALLTAPQPDTYDAIVITVGHRIFREMDAAEFRRFGKPSHVVYDLRHVLPKSAADLRI